RTCYLSVEYPLGQAAKASSVSKKASRSLSLLDPPVVQKRAFIEAWMAPGGTVNLKLEKLRGLTEKSPSVIVSVCDMVMNSRSSCAAVLLLRTTQAIAGSISTAIQIAVFGLERLRTSLRIGTGAGAAAAALSQATRSPVPARAVGTGCPHLRRTSYYSRSSLLHL